MDPIQINLQPDPSKPGGYLTSVAGAGLSITTVADRAAFGLNDTNVRNSFGNLMGKKEWPNNVSYNDPTNWGDVFEKYNWTQLQVQLIPISAVVTNVQVQDYVLGVNSATNNSRETVTAELGFSVSVQNSAETSWSNATEVGVSQAVNYGVKFFGGTTTLSFTQTWEQGGSETQTVELGNTSSITATLEPAQTATATMNGQIGTATVTVTYQASLVGGVFGNYDKKYEGHHFYYLGIDGIMNDVGVSNNITITEEIEVRGYQYVDVTVTVSGTTLVVDRNPALPRTARNPE